MWPFSSPYPERRAEDVAGKTFDYIVVGGGCGGCVVASRLSEDPSVSVLVIDKGRVQDNLLSRIPLASQNYHLSSLQSVKRLSEPIARANGRRLHLWTAEGIGGATRINAMLLTRGVPAGYEEWARDLGLDDWAWARVEPFFRRAENAVDHRGASHRGHDGPVENRQLRPGLERLFGAIEKAAAALGLPVCEDANDPAAPAQGYYYFDVTVDANKRRVSSYAAWLNAKVARERQEHLTVCTRAVASRLEVDAERKRVTGVHIRHALPQGEKQEEFLVKARREVILCSSSLFTPQLLMLSGIGPRDQVEDNGIPLVHELPQVGQNLADHPGVPIMSEIPRRDSLQQLETPLVAIWHFLLYIFLGAGLFSRSTTPSSIFLRTTALEDETMAIRRTLPDGTDTMDGLDPRNIPDAEIMMIPVNCLSPAASDRYLTTFLTTVAQPHSAGRVVLQRGRPAADPRVLYPLLDDPRDAAAMRRAARFAMRAAEALADTGYDARLAFGPGMDLDALDEMLAEGEAKGVQPDGTGAPEPPRPPRAAPRRELKLLDWRRTTDKEVDAYVERVAMSGLHYSCTCRMGRDAKEGVVDQRLRVFGIRGLRVADASVFPKIPSSHTMAPVMMIADRCAEFLKEEWAGKSERPN